MEKYLIGSSLLGLKNARDIDYIVFTDTTPMRARTAEEVENKINYHYRDREQFEKNLRFEFEDYTSISNYQFDKSFVGDNFPIDYKILDYKDKIIELLKHISRKNECYLTKHLYQGNKCCAKRVYHIAYNVFIIMNNSTKLTDEQMSIVQKIHDIEMPIDYIDTLRELIDNL